GAQKLDAKPPARLAEDRGGCRRNKRPRAEAAESKGFRNGESQELQTEQTLREIDLDPVTAEATINKEKNLYDLDLKKEAIAAYDDLIARFGTATELSPREYVALALNNKAVALSSLNRAEEAIEVYNHLLIRFGTATELPLRERVAAALKNKGI